VCRQGNASTTPVAKRKVEEENEGKEERGRKRKRGRKREGMKTHLVSSRDRSSQTTMLSEYTTTVRQRDLGYVISCISNIPRIQVLSVAAIFQRYDDEGIGLGCHKER